MKKERAVAPESYYVEPIQAVKYQIVIMFLIASATALGSVGIVLLAYRRLFNRQHQFRYEAIRGRKGTRR